VPGFLNLECLNLLKLDCYYLRDKKFLDLGLDLNLNLKLNKKYVILLANQHELNPEDILFLLKNILKYLKIPEALCVFYWVNLKEEEKEQDKNKIKKELAGLNLKVLNFGVDVDLDDGVMPLRTLDLSSVLLRPTLKRQVFEDVNRLLLSSSGAE